MPSGECVFSISVSAVLASVRVTNDIGYVIYFPCHRTWFPLGVWKLLECISFVSSELWPGINDYSGWSPYVHTCTGRIVPHQIRLIEVSFSSCAHMRSVGVGERKTHLIGFPSCNRAAPNHLCCSQREVCALSLCRNTPELVCQI